MASSNLPFIIKRRIGNIGIGTNLPQYPLHVAGSIHSTHNYIGMGNIGIGTMDPLYKLHVVGGIHAKSAIVDGTFIATSNIGIGTYQPRCNLHIQGDVIVTGKIYDANFKAYSAGGGGGSANLSWSKAPQSPIIIPVPTAVIQTTSSNVLYRYSGNEIVYNIDLEGTVVTAPASSNLGLDYTLYLPIPYNSTSYTMSNIVGDLWLRTFSNVGSNVYATNFKAFARTFPGGNGSNLTLRYLNGTSERSLTDIATGYQYKLFGSLNYQTRDTFEGIVTDVTAIEGLLIRDVGGQIVLNGGGFAPRGRFDIVQSSCNLPALVVDQQSTNDIIQAKSDTTNKFIVRKNGDLMISGTVYDSNNNALWIPGNAIQWNTAVSPTYTLPSGVGFSISTNNAKYKYAGGDTTYQFTTIGTITGTASDPTANYRITIGPVYQTSAYPTDTIIGDLWILASLSGNTTMYKGFARTVTGTNGQSVTLRYINNIYERPFADFATGTQLEIRGSLIYQTSNAWLSIPSVYTPAKMKQDVDGRIIVSQIESAPAGRFHIKESSSDPAMIIEQTGMATGDIFQYRSNESTRFVVNRLGNVGVGTSTAWHPLDIHGNMRITGNILNTCNEAVWIAGTTVQWKQANPASYVLPTGASMTYTASNASFRYVGNEIVYNFVLSGIVTSLPSIANTDYRLQLQYPLELSAYPTDKIIGDLWFNVTSNVTSTTYKAYAKSSNVSAFSDKVAVRFLNGALDLPISSIAVGSTTTLQGTLIYQTPLSANSQPVPLTAFKQLLQDQSDNLLLNSAPSDASIARFSVYQNSNQPTLLLHDRANLGANPATTDIMQVRRNDVPIFNIRQNGDVRITGNILDTNSNATWIPGSTVEWKQAYTPTINFPTGINFAYTTSNATYRYIGNEVIYNFNITGTVSGTASAPADNYTLNLTYPIKSSAYPTETMIGSIMMGVYTSTGSNTYAAFAKTLPTMPTPADTYKVNLRYLNGTYERSLTDVQATSTLKLQGQLTYTTPLIANNVQVPITYTQSTFTQDQMGNVIFNGGGNAPQGTFEIRSTSNAPALIVNQTTSSNTSDILELKQNNAIKVVVDAQGNVGIGTGVPILPFDLKNTNSALILPQGTSNQRPTLTNIGQMRFNTTLNVLEIYDGLQWSTIALTPSIPTDNMMLFLDGQNTVSYPGSGNSWTSLVPPNIVATNNGATFNASDGSFSFNGTNQYFDITLNNPSGAWVHSVSFWMYMNSNQSALSGAQNPFQFGTLTISKYVGLELTNGFVNYYFFGNDTSYSGNVFLANTWYHIVLTYAGGNANATNKKMYINNIYYPLTGSSTNPLNVDANVTGSLGRDRGRNQSYFAGKIALFKIYNRALSPLEVSNIYNLTKSRFSIPIQSISGCIVQVKQAVLNTRQDIAAANGATWTDVLNLTVTLIPKSSTNSFLLCSRIVTGLGVGGTTVGFRFVRTISGVDTNVGIGNTTADACSFRTSPDNVNFAAWAVPACGDYLDTPNTLLPITYRIQIRTYSTAYPTVINNSYSGGGFDAALAISTFTVYEISN